MTVTGDDAWVEVSRRVATRQEGGSNTYTVRLMAEQVGNVTVTRQDAAVTAVEPGTDVHVGSEGEPAAEVQSAGIPGLVRIGQ